MFPLTDELKELLEELAEKQKRLGIESAYVFVHDTGEPIKVTGYDSFISRLSHKLGFQSVSNHTFRRSLNSNVFIENGIEVADRAKLLGHSVEVNLKNYSYAQKDYLDKARNVLNKSNHQPRVNTSEHFSVIPFTKEKSPKPVSL